MVADGSLNWERRLLAELLCPPVKAPSDHLLFTPGDQADTS